MLKCKKCTKELFGRQKSFCSNNCKMISLTETTRSKEGRENLRFTKLGNKNPNWIGNNIGQLAVHLWINRNFKKPKKCQKCNKMKPLDLANISQKYNYKTYTRDIKNWEWLCRKCHMTKDGRLEKMNALHKARKVPDTIVKCAYCKKELLVTGSPGRRRKTCSGSCATKLARREHKWFTYPPGTNPFKNIGEKRWPSMSH